MKSLLLCNRDLRLVLFGMRIFLIVLLTLLGLIPAYADSQATASDANLVIVNARLIDGLGGPPIDGISILVEDGIITQVGKDIDPSGRSVLDASGMSVLPGLIDSHVHLNSVPGSLLRNDGRADYERMRAEQLRAYVASGVTTILEAAAPRDLHAWATELTSAGHPGPTILMLAPFLTPAGGYFADEELRNEAFQNLWPAIADARQLSRYMDAVTTNPNVVGVKVTMEKGAGPIAVWPIFTPEMRRQIRVEAAKRHLPIYAHSMSDPMHDLALDLSPKALVHAGYHDGAPTPETLAEIRRSGATVTSTLAIYDRLLIQWEREQLSEPLMKLVTPPEQIETADNDAAWAEVSLRLAQSSAPKWTPRFVLPMAARWFLSESAIRRRVASSKEALGQMHRAGIPIVLGTDSGCWPVFTTMFHGTTTLRELELLVDAGMTPLEAIVAATSRPAELHGVGDRVGSVEVGKQADLLLVRGDPSVDISAIYQIGWVLKSGVAKTPEGWMKSID